MKINSLQQAKEFLYQYIPTESRYKFPGEVGIWRTKELLKHLDNPQNKLKVIHIAGTSGKGSTAYYISAILKEHGHKVGLFLSPHLVDIRERFQINNRLLDEQTFCGYLEEIIPAIEKVKNTYEYGAPTFFEITVVLAYYIYSKQKVDYAVIETGLGGLYDGTNVVETKDKVAVLTRIGFDHTEILGNTLEAIATQKAGIIHLKNTVIALSQDEEVNRIFESTAKEKLASLHFISQRNYSAIQQTVQKVTYNFNFNDLTIKHIQLQTSALYQVENSSIAMAACLIVSKRDNFKIEDDTIKNALYKASFPGRVDIVKWHNKKLIIDGAHNPQKMHAFITSLQKMFPKKKFLFILAFKKGKDYAPMLREIIPMAEQIVISQFYPNNISKQQGFNIQAEDPKTIAHILDSEGFHDYVMQSSTNTALEYVKNGDHKVVVITGSLYFVGEVYSLLH